MAKDIREIVCYLDKSLMFNLSLGDKELFHSNYISWLCNNYRQFMFNIFSEFANNSYNVKSIKKSEREKEKIDITIHFDNAILYIENKMKSLPREEQLNEYFAKKANNTKDNLNKNYLLLTLFKANFALKDWKETTYREIASKLRSNFNNFTNEGKIDNEEYVYHKSVLNDYINFLESVSDLSCNFVVNLEDSLFKATNFDSAIEKKIKLKGFFLSVVAQQIADLLCEKIKGNTYLKEIMVRQKKVKSVSKSESILCINDGNSYGAKVIIYVYYYNKNNIGLFLALDGKNYQKGVICADNKYIKKAKKYYQELATTTNWLSFDYLPKDYKKNDKNKRISDDIKKFYDGKYLYEKIELNTNIKLTELIEMMHKDILKMKKLLSENSLNN